jgi:ABC transporter substrate binding protein
VPSLAHPGGNITGFANPEFSIAGKWADLLKQMVPSIARVALVFNPETSPQSRLFANVLEAGATSLGVEVIAAPVHSTAEIEATLARLSRERSVMISATQSGRAALCRHLQTCMGLTPRNLDAAPEVPNTTLNSGSNRPPGIFRWKRDDVTELERDDMVRLNRGCAVCLNHFRMDSQPDLEPNA